MNFIKVATTRLVMTALLCRLFTGGEVARADSDDTVGELGDPRKLVFEGNQNFSADNLRNGLLQNPQFLLASHPAAPLKEYPNELIREINAGYENAGFPETEVKTSVDAKAGKITITIKEGPRYHMADIHVSGAKKIPVATLIKELQEKPDQFRHTRQLISERLASYGAGSTGNSPEGASVSYKTNSGSSNDGDIIWKKGDPATLGVGPTEQVTADVQKILTQLGFDHAKVKVEKVLNAAKHTVDLRIDILDEGLSGKVGDIEITGLKRNRREDVLKYLELKPGMKFDRALQEKLELRLWHSARFLAFKITPTDQNASQGGLVKLTIDLVEYERLPPLREKFSRGAEALVRLCDWLQGPECAREDIVFEMPEQKELRAAGVGGLRFIFSSHGLILTETDATNAGHMPLHYAVVISETAAGLYDFHAGNRLTTPALMSNMVLTVFARVMAETNKEDPFSLTLGGGFFPQSDAKLDFVVDRFFNPTAFSRIAYDKGVGMNFARGEMTLTNDVCTLRIDEKTGRLLQLNVHDTNSVEGKAGIEKGAYQRAEKEIVQAGLHNAYEADHPLDSQVGFLIEEIAQIGGMLSQPKSNISPEKVARAATALRKILAQHAFAPLDEMVTRRSSAEGEEDFFVPVDVLNPQQPKNSFLAAIAGFVFRYGNDLFPRNSWPWTVMRESVFVLNGNGKYTGAELKRLADSGDTGPLGYDVMAHLLARANSPMSKAMAIQGLLHLQKEDFRKDWELVLKQDCVLAKAGENLARALSHLSDEDVAALGAIMRPEDAAFLQQSAKVLRNQGNKSVADTLAPVLDDYWDQRLQEKVRADLKKLAASAPAEESK